MKTASAALAILLCTSLEAQPLQLRVVGPEEGEHTLLPTPYRVLQQTESDERIEIEGDFGDVVFNPLLSIEEGRIEDIDDIRAEASERLKWRTEKLVEKLVETKIDLISRRPVLYLELSGYRVFWLYDSNFLEGFSRRKEEVLIGSIELPEVDTKELNAVRFSLFRYDDRISADTITRIRSDYTKNRESQLAYLSQYTRSKDKDGNFVEGLTGPKGRNREYEGFVFSTCVEFRDRSEAVESPLWDESSKCWIYDFSQMNQLLPSISGRFVLETRSFQEQKGEDSKLSKVSFQEFEISARKVEAKFVTLR